VHGRKWRNSFLLGAVGGCRAGLVERGLEQIIRVRGAFGHHRPLAQGVPSLRTQTHGDWVHADMNVYRRRLRQLGGCPVARAIASN
jgi:hypothetical protein